MWNGQNIPPKKNVLECPARTLGAGLHKQASTRSSPSSTWRGAMAMPQQCDDHKPQACHEQQRVIPMFWLCLVSLFVAEEIRLFGAKTQAKNKLKLALKYSSSTSAKSFSSITSKHCCGGGSEIKHSNIPLWSRFQMRRKKAPALCLFLLLDLLPATLAPRP